MARDVVTIGTFDGVHRGHQSVLAVARAAAAARGGKCIAYTFDVPPRAITGEQEPRLLLPPSTKRLLLRGWVDRVLEAPFHKLRELEPRAFVNEVLVRELAAGAVVVGESFRFGRDRTGDISVLAKLACDAGLELTVVPALTIGDEPVSSTQIRRLLQAGDIARATSLLGRPPLLLGTVVPGDGIGRTLGFPTANLGLDPRILLPQHGVYLSRAFGAGIRSAALTYVGSRPTMSESPIRCEVHLLEDPRRDVRDEMIEVHLHALLRTDRAFATLDALRRQMILDLEVARLAAGAFPDRSDPGPFGG
jgi:riboflavin kinase/FMN adenylyltransferase